MAGPNLRPVKENVLPSVEPLSIGPMIPLPKTAGAYELSEERKNNIIPLPAPNSDSSGFTKIVSSKDLFENRQYDSYDPEKSPDFYAYGQSTTDKAVNGLVKFAGKTATTIAGNTIGLAYGLGSWAIDRKFSSFYDNDFFKSMDKIDEELRISNPHLYTQAEIDDPLSANAIFSGNFLWDKIVSNLGYAAGAALSGYGATAALEALGLSKALVAAGRGMQALEASNTAVAEGRGLSSMLTNLRNATGSFLEGSGTVSAGAKFSQGSQLAGSFLGSTGESGMESYQAKKQALATSINLFKQTNGGREPNEKEMAQLVDTAERIGNATFGLNMALLTATNNFQLPKIFGSSFSADKIGLTKMLFKEGKWASSLPQGRFGKMLYGTYKGASLFFNPAEAFEEGAQYAIEKGTSNYFSRSNYNKEDSWFSDLAGLLTPGGEGVLGKGIGETLTSNEGLESILIGGLSGSMMTSGIFTAGRTGDIAQRGVFGYGGKEGELRNKVISEWNKTPFVEKIKEMKEFMDRSEMTQIMRDQAIRVGDILEAKDLEADYMLGYMLPRIKYGGGQAIKEEINAVREQARAQGMQGLIESGYANENDTLPNFLARLSNIENTASLVEKSYAQLNEKLSGEILRDEEGNPIFDSNKQPIRKYSSNLINKLVYSTAKIADYTERSKTLQDTLTGSGIVVTDIIDAINNDATPEEVTAAIDKQADKIIGLKDKSDLIKTDMLTKLQDVSEIQMRKKGAIKEQNEMLSSPETFAEETTNIVPEDEVKAKVKVKTKDGEEDLEVGTEYYLGKVTEHDSKGNEVYRFPKLTILGENEDGTIKIQTSNGRVRDVSKDELLDYKLGKVSDVERNPNANFYLRNINKVAYWNRGKAKGGKQQGRIRYDSKTDKLTFVYNAGKGKIRTIDITQESFQPGKGYKEGIFSFGGELTAEDTADYNKAKSSGQLKKNLDSILANRGNVVQDLYDSTSANLEHTKKMVAEKTEQLEKIQQELKEAQEKANNPEYTKAKKFKAVTKNAIKAVKRLAKMQDLLILEIQSLENEQEQLELNLNYVVELYDKLGEYPTDSNEFIQDLEKERDELEYLVDETRREISTLQSLLGDIKGALDVAVEFVHDLIEKFAAKYPNLPFGQNELRDFLNKNIEDTNRQKDVTPSSEAEKMLPYTAVSGALLDDLSNFDREIAELDDIEIIPREKQIDEINDEISKAVDKLFELKKQLKAKDEVLNRFKQIAEEYNKRKAREQKLRTDEKLIAQVLGTQNQDIENNNLDKNYQPDPKKNWLQVVLSTITPSKKTAKQLKEHQIRANEFAYRTDYDTIKNLRAVVVTKNNEAKLGLKGFMDKLVEGSDFTAESVISVVITDKKGRPVGLDGKVLAKPSFDNAIFQTMPTAEKLPELFRTGTPNVDELIKEYRVWRKEQFANTDVNPVGFVTSFGNPEYVEVLSSDGKTLTRDYNSTVPVVDSGLITDNDLNNKQVVYVHTADTSAQKGTTSFEKALGKVFLNLKNGFVKLNARNYTKQEADTIFEAIKFLSNNMFEKGTIKDEQSKRVVSWLRTIAYWGKPKEKAGYNSIWFEKVAVPGTGLSELRLFMSGKDGNFSFDPDSLEANRGAIITLLEQMYVNVNARRVNDAKLVNQPYEEIIGFKNGQIVTRDVSKDFPDSKGKWPNYQTFLLSAKGRESNQIPLTTNIRPLDGPNDVNRAGYYFTLTGNEDRFQTAYDSKPVVAQPTVPAPTGKLQITPAPATPVQQLPQVVASSSGIVRDGITPNTIDIKLSNGTLVGQATYTIDENNNLNVIDSDKITEDLAMALNASLEQAERAIANKIFSTVKEAFTTPVTQNVPSVTVAPAPVVAQANVVAVQPVPDSSVKSAADIMAKLRRGGVDNAAMRQIIGNQLKAFKPENWNEVEAWLKTNFANVPVYRVKNVLKSTNGRQAWGMFSDGAIYIYADAELGTVYHEVFHAVWRMFADPKEVQDVINEFKGRSGSFEERTTGKQIKYSEATADQIEEELAEEFRDFVNEGKRPVKNQSGMSFIARLFDDLVSFIKEFFTGPNSRSNTETLFNKIGGGYFNQFTPFNSELSYSQKGLIDIEQVIVPDGAALRSMFSSGNINDAVQHMLYRTVTDLVNKNSDLSNANNPRNRRELYQYLRDDLDQRVLLSGIAAEDGFADGSLTEDEANSMFGKALAMHDELMNNEETWEHIIEQYEEKITSYDIKFDENDEIVANDDAKSGKGEYHAANQIDLFKKANSQIKLLLSSIPYPNPSKPGEFKFSSINGATLIPVSQVRMSLLNKINSATTIDDMMEEVRKMALEDVRFVPIYTRITKNTDLTVENQGFPNLKTMADVALVNSFWRTFKTANPVVKNLFVLANGDVVIGDSNFSTAARDIRFDYINAIKSVVRNNNKFFELKSKVDADGRKTSAYYGKADSPARIASKTIEQRIALLHQLGIEFDKNKLEKLFRNSPNDQVTFNKAVADIRKGIVNANEFMSVDGKTLDIDGDLLKLAEIQAKIDNPEFSSTYYNVNGERVQTYIGTNPMSDLADVLSKITNLNQLENTKFSYLLTDSFSQNSYIINSMFDRETGNKKEIAQQLLQVGYADGIVNVASGKNTSSSRLKYSQRLLQEINLNAKGFYLNLVPGDASMEHMVYMGLPVNFTDAELSLTTDDIYAELNSIFKGYFIDEFNLAEEDRRIVQDKSKSRKPTDLRFFKEILDNFEPGLHNKIVSSTKSAEDTYKDYKSKIEGAVNKYVKDEAERTKVLLSNNGIIQSLIEDGIPTDNFQMNSVDIPGSDDMTQTELDRAMLGFAANYMVANIELHKVMYSDPYQYKDELKRIKNFNSPRQPLMNGSTELNSAMNRVWNQGFTKEDIGYVDFMRDYFRSISLDDINSIEDLIGYNTEDDIYEETDGAGIISAKAYRNYRIHEGSWDMNTDEIQYRYDVAFEKMAKDNLINQLTDNELELLAKYGEEGPQIKSAYTPIKPIVAGNRFDEELSYNDVVLDKFALYPISYRLAVKINEAALEQKKTSNLVNMHNKMSEEDIDYAVYATGRKVGNYEGTTNALYSKEGKFSTEPFHDIVNIPMSVISTQTDVPSKDTPLVTRGSQNTKLVTLDFMDNGIPVDFEKNKDFAKRYEAWNKLKTDEARFKASPLYKEIKTNEKFLEEIIDNGYNELLNALGIIEVDGGWEMKYPERTAETLKSEMLKREVNKNISDALKGFEKGQVILEATPAYQQIRNILYSIADSHVISPKISGGMKVQIPSRLLEENEIEKVKVGNKEAYQSDVLKFYKKDGKQVCEMMVGRWFNSSMNDHDLLEYLNKTPEGQEILSGLAYRIPTQKQNSIDSFVIKQFLPKEFGDSVVVPAALVKKAGSDFDIDKLNIYLKSVFTNLEGKPEMFRYQGSEKATKDFYGNMFDTLIQSEESNVLKQLLNLSLSEFDDPEYEAKLQDRLGKIDKRRINRDKFINNAYKSALQNGYIQSSQNLVSHPENFDRLVTPNSAEQLKELAKEINKLRGLPESDNATTGAMLNRSFMSKLRHDFVVGKYAIGIAAVAQTNHSLNQRSSMYIDLNMLDKVELEDKPWLGDGEVRFKNVNRIQVGDRMMVSLSGIKNKAGEFISDILGQFIDGYVDIAKGAWIMDLGATPDVAGTYMFLVKIGVPIDTVAYFMNQPLIRKYLNTLERENKSWLFNPRILDLVLPEFDEDVVKNIKEIPSNTQLKEYIKGSDLYTNKDTANMQVFMLLEFLKYAKMANHLYKVTQGTNFDTAAFSDPYMIFKKDEQLKVARKTIISSADKLLESSFLGKLSNILNSLRNAMATILISDRSKVRKTLQATLLPYIDSNDRDFMKISQKAVNDIFDWAVQTNTNGKNVTWNESIKSILIDNGSNVPKFVMMFKDEVLGDPNHPLHNNQVINLISADDSSGRENAVKNLKIKNKDNKIYDQNQMIFAFEELRDYLYGVPSIYGISGKSFYKNIVGVSILQSGLSQSNISFTNLLPYTDFTAVYNEVLSTIDKLDGIEAFHTESVLNRNNWNDSRFTPNIKAQLFFSKKKKKYYYNMPMWFIGNNKDIQKAIDANEIPQMLNVSLGSEGSNRDVIVYSWEEKLHKNWRRDKAIKKEMRKKGDYSYIKKGLFKKVYENGEPVMYDSYNGRYSYVYKMINAWGHSKNANEFYTNGRKSVIDNGFVPVDEKTDKQVMAIINPVIGDRRSNVDNISNSLSLLSLTKDESAVANDAFETVVDNDPRVVELDKKIAEASALVSSGKSTPQTFANIRKYHQERGKLVKELKYKNC